MSDTSTPIHERNTDPELTYEQMGLSNYYCAKFRMFDAKGGNFQPSWNWLAFFFGAIWYACKGMWIRALIILALSILLSQVAGGLPGIFFWIYMAVKGNWDFYRYKAKGQHLN